MSESQRVAIVMSRMPRLVHPDANWLAGLRACLRRVQQRSQQLLTASGTAGADFVSRGAERLGVDVKCLNIDTSKSDSSDRDRELIDQADAVLVLGLRKEGNIHRLLTSHLEAGRRGVYLVDLAGLQPDSVRQQVVTAGAEMWLPTAAELIPLMERSESTSHWQATDSNARPNVISIASPQTLPDLFLTHTTRACPGPWPRQSTEDYLDRLLDSRPDGDHSAFMTLARIIEQRKLIASSKTIRGGYPVISLTAVALADLPQLRVFRAHRTRWDFEPYGLCLRRSALQRCGSRPVLYGSEETWTTLSEGDRPCFQLSGTVSNEADGPAIDWSVEQEWRHLGDLDLSSFDVDDVLVFVPSYAEARLLQPHCPWPVTLWPGELQ